MRVLSTMLLAVLSCVLIVGLGTAAATTWYVDVDNGDDANDGLSWNNPCASITNALDKLAAANLASGFTGGHLVLVTNGPYQNTAGNRSAIIQVTTNHNGAAGTPNVIRGLNAPLINASGYGPYGIRVDGDGSTTRAADVLIEGFEFTDGYDPTFFEYCERITIANCVFREWGSYETPGVHLDDYAAVTLTNCLVMNYAETGIVANRSTSELILKNCIVLGHGMYGVYVRSGATCEIWNSLIYANVLGGVYSPNGTLYTTDADISADAYETSGAGYMLITNCVARNPGFADMMGHWTWDTFYDNSPCLTGGEGGIRMGWKQNVNTVATSSKTYYVKPDGDNTLDGLSEANAWSNISYAASLAVAGDTVIVMAGTYNGDEVWITNGASYNKPLTYRAEGEVVLQGTAYPIRLFGCIDTTLDGFEVQGSTRGIYVYRSPLSTLTNMDAQGSGDYAIALGWSPLCTIVDSSFHDSNIGMHLYDGTFKQAGGRVIDRCRVYGNSQHGIIAHARRDRIQNCHIYDNGYSGIRLGHTGASLLYIYNCNIYSNGYSASAGEYQDGITLDAHGSPVTANCTFYGNKGEGMQTDNYDMYVYNCIFAGNGNFAVKEGPPYSGSAQDFITKNCLFWDNGSNFGETDSHFCDIDGSGTFTTNILRAAEAIDLAPDDGLADNCTNSIVADPLFVSTTAPDLRVKVDSPTIDAGDESLVSSAYFPDQDTDINGVPRLKLTALDIGAAEWQPWSGTIILVR